MKIVIIGPFPKPIHGCSLANEILAKQLRFNKNISVSTINSNTENISSENVGHFSFKKVFSFLKVYKKISNIKKCDVIYTTPGQTFFGVAKYIPFYLFCLLYKKPYIIHIHGNHLGNEFKSLTGFNKWFFSYFIKKASAGIVLSNSLRNNFEGLLIQDKVFVVENFAQDDLTQKLELNKSNNKLHLLYLSNLMEEKGIIDFLDSLLLLKKENIDFTADIAGKIEDESQDKINNKLIELGDLVNYHGVVYGKNKIDLLQKSNVFVLPTYYKIEGQPIALIEAMGTGNIIVTTKFSGIPDIVSEKNGYFIQPKNPQSIFDIFVNINKNLEQQIDKYSNSNIQYVKANFTEAHFAHKILNIIDQIKNNN
jgi:glycosyltransferase involved in cell wall biosynthesis